MPEINDINTVRYISPSLYNSWQYYLKSDQNKGDFIDVLKRVKKPDTDAIVKGKIFEEAVTDIAKTGTTDKLDKTLDADELKTAQQIAEIVKGGAFQCFLTDMKILPNIHICGIADVIKNDKIYDIKRVTNYEVGKYSDSIQHEIYMYLTGILQFDYLISDGRDIYIESYTSKSRDELFKTIFCKISDFINFIKNDPELWAAFLNRTPKNHIVSDNWSDPLINITKDI